MMGEINTFFRIASPPGLDRPRQVEDQGSRPVQGSFFEERVGMNDARD